MVRKDLIYFDIIIVIITSALSGLGIMFSYALIGLTKLGIFLAPAFSVMILSYWIIRYIKSSGLFFNVK